MAKTTPQLVALPLLLIGSLALGACGDDPVSDALPEVECTDNSVTSDPCEGRTCFTACGVQIVIDDPPIATGVAPDIAPTKRPDAARRVGLAIIGVNAYEVQGLDPVTAELQGVVRFPGAPEAIAAVDFLAAGQVAFVQADTGAIFPLELSDISVPRAAATWRPTAPVEVVEASADRLYLRTPTGVSVLDVRDADAPAEDACLAYPSGGASEDFYDIDANSNFVVLSGGEQPRAWIFDLLRLQQPASPLPIDVDTAATLYDQELLITTNGTTVAYHLTPGQPVQQTGPIGTNVAAFDPPIYGDFLFLGDKALDISVATPPYPVYNVVPPDANSCTIALNPASNEGDSWIIAPDVAPDRRFRPALVPDLACPPDAIPHPGTTNEAARGGATKVALRTDAGLTVVDVSDASESTLPDVPGDLHWVGAHIVGIENAGTAANGILHVQPAAGGAATTIDLGVPLVAASAGTDALWLVLEPEPRAAGDDPPSPRKHELFRALPDDGFATRVAVDLPKDGSPIGVVAAGTRAYVLDHFRLVHAIEADGTDVFTAEVPQGFGETAVASTDLGVFFDDLCGDLTWVDPTGTVRKFAPESPLAFRAAGQLRVYVEGSDSPYPDLARGPVLFVMVPSPSAEGFFTLDEAARIPLPREDATVLPGNPVIMVRDGLYTLVTVQ